MKKSIKIAVVLLSFIALRMLNNPEKKITSFVLSNQVDLLDISTDYLNGETTINSFKNVKIDGVFTGEHTIVQFLYSGFGLVPASKYYGFYYSQDNTPTAFQNTNNYLSKNSNDEWKWTDGTDNGGITKKICDNWFYYEAWF